MDAYLVTMVKHSVVPCFFRFELGVVWLLFQLMCEEVFDYINRVV